MKFSLTINMPNDPYDDQGEVVRLLRDLAARLELYFVEPGMSQPLYDQQGNECGYASCTTA